MIAPDKIWLHPIVEDVFQDVWFTEGDGDDVAYVPAIALAEAQATIARQQVMLDRALENGGKLMIENARLREALRGIVESDDMAAELFTNDTDRADNYADIARAALSPVAPDQGEG